MLVLLISVAYLSKEAEPNLTIKQTTIEIQFSCLTSLVKYVPGVQYHLMIWVYLDQVTCVCLFTSAQGIIGTDNDLSSDRCKAII